MGQSIRTRQSSDDSALVLERLVRLQKNEKEGSPAWYAYQEEINQIIAENFLFYLNR